MKYGARKVAIIALALCLGAFFALTPGVQAGKVQLAAGQALKVKIDEGQAVSSGSLKKGDKVKISLAEPIVIGGVTIVEAGAAGTATVAEITPAGKPGKGGAIKIVFEEMQGKGAFKPKGAIKLDGDASAKGGNKKIVSYILGFGLLIKGGQGQFAPGTVLDAKIKEAVMLEN